LIQLLLTTWRRRPAPGTAKPIRGKWLHWLLSFIAKRLLARDEELAVAPPEQRRMLVRAATGYLSDPIEGRRTLLRLSSWGWVVFLAGFTAVHAAHAVFSTYHFRWESTWFQTEQVEPVVDSLSNAAGSVGLPRLPAGYLASIEWDSLKQSYTHDDDSARVALVEGRLPAFVMGLVSVLIFGVVPRLIVLRFARSRRAVIRPSTEDLRELDLVIRLRDGFATGKPGEFHGKQAPAARPAASETSGRILVIPFGATMAREALPSALFDRDPTDDAAIPIDVLEAVDGERAVAELRAKLEGEPPPVAACVLVALEQRMDVALKKCVELAMSRAPDDRTAVIATHVMRSPYASSDATLQQRLAGMARHLIVVPPRRLLLLDSDLSCPSTLRGALCRLIAPLAQPQTPAAPRMLSPCFLGALSAIAAPCPAGNAAGMAKEATDAWTATFVPAQIPSEDPDAAVGNAVVGMAAKVAGAALRTGRDMAGGLAERGVGAVGSGGRKREGV
jgi:hypothetical protein